MVSLNGDFQLLRKVKKWIILLICFTALVTFAQEDSIKVKKTAKEEYLIFSNFPVFTNSKEQKISNLLYSGPGFGFANASEAYRENWRFRILNLSGVFTYQQPYTQTSQVFNPRLDIGFWTYKKWYEDDFQRLFAGASIYSLLNAKVIPELGNSSISAELFPFIQIPIWYERQVKLLKRDFTGFAKFEFPLYGYFFRLPKFAVSGLDGIGSFHAPFWRFQRTNFEFGLERKLPNLPNKWRIAYQWEFYHYTENEVFETHTVYHYLKISWLLRRK